MYDASQPIRIEASQKGWLAIRALSDLVGAIAALETGEGRWEDYFSAKGETLLALKGFEVWHGKGVSL